MTSYDIPLREIFFPIMPGPLPETVAEHNHLAPVRPVFVSRKRSALRDLRAKQTKEIRADLSRADLFGIRIAGQVRHAADAVCGDILDHRGLPSKQIELCSRPAAGKRALRRSDRE